MRTRKIGSEPRSARPFELEAHAQIGLRYFISDNWSLDIEGGYQHISNAGMASRNAGVNAGLGGQRGVTYHFPGRHPVSDHPKQNEAPGESSSHTWRSGRLHLAIRGTILGEPNAHTWRAEPRKASGNVYPAAHAARLDVDR